MLQSEAIKCIAETIARLAEDLNKKGQYNEQLQAMDQIINAELELEPKKEKRSGGNGTYHYEGIEAAMLEPSKRPAAIELKVLKGEDVVLSFHVDRTFKWLMRQNKDLNWYACGRISLNTKTKWNLATSLKKLADKEVEQPGAFAEKFLPPVIE